MADSARPIIIKKVKKVSGHGHHGGAWKVAYADFVTAMMAFFLLMWLLNATEAEKLAGLADYFAPTVGVNDQLGIGFRGGKGPLSKGIGADKNTNKGIIQGGVPSGPVVKSHDKEIQTDLDPAEKITINEGDPKVLEDKAFAKVEGQIEEQIKNSPNLRELEDSVDIEITSEGLEIRIVDKEGRPMFERGSAALMPHMQDILTKLAEIITLMPNYISISGHTSSIRQTTEADYGNWELSVDRANASRRYLLQKGMQDDQVARVVGKADNDPLLIKEPENTTNNRISIVVLRQGILPYHKQAAPEAVFVDTERQNIKQSVEENIINEQEALEEQKQMKLREERREELQDVIKMLELEDKIDEEILRESEELPAEVGNGVMDITITPPSESGAEK